MSKQKNHLRIIENGKQKTIERKSIRSMLVLYDAVIYVLCWAVVFLLRPAIVNEASRKTSLMYLAVGFVLFFGCRLLCRCYNQIWRYGSIRSFAKELTASVAAAGLFLATHWLVVRKMGVERVPTTAFASFVAIYVIVSIAIRFLYYYFYNFAIQDKPLARVLRRCIEIFAFVDFNSKDPGATLHLVLESQKANVSPINELQNIVDKFAIRGEVTDIIQINKGYINRTYRVDTLSETGHVHQYTLQRINTNVFPDPDALMENFKLTTNHLSGRLKLSGSHARGSVTTLRPTKDGCAYLRDDSGCWRMLTYFDKVYSLDIPDSPETFYQAGKAFGMFAKEMSDVEVSEVKEVITNFHNTMSRYRDLEKAIVNDPKGRVKQVLPEIAFVRGRVDRYGMISEALESGRIPTRVCHNDCNLNNILFDNESHLPVAIIDLDTVMPSTPLYDFGDSIRIGTNTAKDDEKDLSKVSCDLNLYEKYAQGYLEACGKMLTKEELRLLPYAALIITSEDGIRFLMDHINGDTYYNIYYPGQNLDRARTQLKLVEDMEKKLPEIKHILKKIYAKLGLEA